MTSPLFVFATSAILLFYQMQTGSKTEIAREPVEQSFQGSQVQQLEISSKLSSSNYPMRFHQGQEQLQARSEAPRSIQRSLESAGYKKALLKLMSLVKLERYGYQQADINQLVDLQIAAIEDLEAIEGKDLDLRATEICLRIVSGLLGEPYVLIPRLSHRGSSTGSQVAPMEVIIEAMQPERMDEMQERMEAEDRVQIVELEERRVIQIMPRLPLPRLQMGLRMRRQIQRQRQVERMQANIPQILCNICYVPSKNYCKEECGHSFCLECLKGYLRENQRSGNYIIKCPEYDCPSHVSIQVVKLVLSPKQFQRFLYFRDKNQKEMNPQNKFCSKPDCGELLEKAQDRLRCPRCESTYCQICLQPYHNDAACDIVLRHSIEHTYKSFQIKKCPGCKSPIEKSEGCNHMTCKKCKYQFCWLCLGKYSRHHYKYYNCFGCPGMQFEDPQQIVAERCKQLLLYLLLPFMLALVLFCYLSALPLYALGSFVYNPCSWADSGKDFIEEYIVEAICNCCLGPASSRALLWLLYQPRAILYAVFISPTKLTMMFCGEICKLFQ